MYIRNGLYRCPLAMCSLYHFCHSDPEGVKSSPFNSGLLELWLVHIKLLLYISPFEICLLVSLLPHHDYLAFPNVGVHTF